MTTPPVGYTNAALGPREPILDDILRSSLLEHRLPTIQVDDNAARLLQLLTTLRAPRRVLEIGTLFGYSTIHLARGLPAGATLTSLEVDPRAADVARANLGKAGVGDRVEVITGDARDYLRAAPRDEFGLIFIDADKRSYVDYLKLAFPLLESGGLLVADDAFAVGDFGGERVAGDDDAEAAAIRTYVAAVARSPHLFSCFAGTESGLIISIKG
ncbi:O-methyltransferase [Actinokineospora xionganensis]|uniref:Class I SAM-dependent methyltransferase n=1 Tax=Actinokineospora xionganensis TaxID=2684470 RepID=A0ABR7L003_9PSEU|nr:class I SAM-dependent methyltransferase [Actinokineospora xionganensis]MBC6446011.1 class I SAM-dependent methyltransferase [Actinokineospora xionganensis]